VASGIDHDILASVPLVGHWGGLTACGEVAFPKLFSGFNVECADVVVHSCADEDDATRRDDRAAKIGGAKWNGKSDLAFGGA